METITEIAYRYDNLVHPEYRTANLNIFRYLLEAQATNKPGADGVMVLPMTGEYGGHGDIHFEFRVPTGGGASDLEDGHGLLAKTIAEGVSLESTQEKPVWLNELSQDNQTDIIRQESRFAQQHAKGTACYAVLAYDGHMLDYTKASSLADPLLIMAMDYEDTWTVFGLPGTPDPDVIDRISESITHRYPNVAMYISGLGREAAPRPEMVPIDDIVIADVRPQAKEGVGGR